MDFSIAYAIPMKHCSLPSLIALLTIVSSLSAQDLPQADTKTLLKQLDQIASGAENKLQSRRNNAISQIQSATSSGSASVDFYLHALENTQYKESAKDFLEWRKRSGDLLRSSSMQTAAQLQLRYLIIALQRSEQHNALAQVPEVLNYLSLLAAFNAQSAALGDKQFPEIRPLLQQPLQASAVVDFFKISDLLPSGKDFENSPGNYQEIMDKNVREPLRANKDPRLPGTWDTQIAVEANIATSTQSKQQAETFNQSRLPDLLFKKAKDTAAIGQPNRSLSQVMALIQGYPANPNMKQWIENARALIADLPSSATAVSPATTPAPAPAATVAPSAIKAPGATN